jgi:hypothetical protein
LSEALFLGQIQPIQMQTRLLQRSIQSIMADLVVYSPEELKSSDKIRQQTAAQADKIFNKVKKFMA